MAGGARSGARLAVGRKGEGPASSGERPRRATSAYVLIAVALALLTLAIYTGFSIVKLQRETARTPELGGAASSAAAALAGQTEGQVARLEAALGAAGAVAVRNAGEPMDAAEAALKAAQPTARAVALVGDDGVRAIAGDAGDADWAAAAKAARAAGQSLWIGKVGHGDSQAIYVAEAAPPAAGDNGRLLIIALADLAPAALGEPDRTVDALALVTPDGRVLAVSGKGGVSQAGALDEAFQVDSAGLFSGAIVAGALPDGTKVLLTARKVAGGALYAVAAQPSDAAAAARESVNEDLFSLIAPLLVGIALALLLLLQSRKARGRRSAPSSTASGASAWRSRRRAAASGNGTWTPTSSSCPTSPARCWAGAAAASSPAEQVLERIAPEHRDRVRQALAAARHPRRLRRLLPRRPTATAALGLDRRPRPGDRRARRRRLRAHRRRGARRHRGAHRPGPRPGGRGAPARRDRERARRPSCSGTARAGW